MRDSARYAWWLLIFLFTLLILGNITIFWKLFRTPETPGLNASNVQLGVEFQTRYALGLEQLGLGEAAFRITLDSVFKSLDEAFAPYEAAVYRAILESAFGVGDPKKTLQSLPDLPSERLTPNQRRWQAMRWQEAFTDPLKPDEVPAMLNALPDAPSRLAGQLLELALYQRAGDTAKANALRESLGRAAGWAIILFGAVIGTVSCAGIGGLIVLIIYLIRLPRLPARPAPDESPFVYDPLLWALAIFLLVMLNASALDPMLHGFGIDASNTIYLLAVLLPLMYLTSLQDEPGALGRIRWFEGAWWKQLGVGLAGYAAYVPFLGALLLVTVLVAPALPAEQTNPIGERAAGSQTALQWLWIFIQAAVLAPIIEEFVFRGVLFKVLWQRTGRVWLSAFVSGYLFAVIHPQFLGGIFPITVLGTLLALVYAHTRSLLPCIIIHALNNGLITLMLWSVAG
ncbi:MAG: CPBP family intramembrane metalloprotease [Fimbriimonadales bacterium]|nr:CPBP family intramembrane metalloprotease [Fimbriimonadales bacterium]